MVSNRGERTAGFMFLTFKSKNNDKYKALITQDCLKKDLNNSVYSKDFTKDL